MKKRRFFSAALLTAGLLLTLVFGVRSSSATEGDLGGTDSSLESSQGTDDGSAGEDAADEGTADEDSVEDVGQSDSQDSGAVDETAADETVVVVNGADGSDSADTGILPTENGENETGDGTETGETVQNYTIIYNLNGGVADNPTVYGPNSDAITLNNPTRAGYDFAGWVGICTDDGRAVDFISDMMNVTIPAFYNKNLSFTAIYTRAKGEDGDIEDIPDVSDETDENGLKSQGAFTYNAHGNGQDIRLDSDDIYVLQEHIDTLSAIVNQNKENISGRVNGMDNIMYDYSKKDRTIVFRPADVHEDVSE